MVTRIAKRSQWRMVPVAFCQCQTDAIGGKTMVWTEPEERWVRVSESLVLGERKLRVTLKVGPLDSAEIIARIRFELDGEGYYSLMGPTTSPKGGWMMWVCQRHRRGEKSHG